MDFTLSEEQEMLRDAAQRFVSERHSFETARKIAAGDGMSREHWQMFAELGWLSLLVREEDGGLGWSMIDVAILAETFGGGLVAAPFAANAVAGVRLISECRLGERDTLLARLAGGEILVALATEEAGSRYDLAKCWTSGRRMAEGIRLDGRKILVHDGAFADFLFVTARIDGDKEPSLLLVPRDAPGVHVRGYATIDSRRVADVILEGAVVDEGAVMLEASMARPAIEKTLDEMRVAMAAEALGSMEKALEMTVGYLQQRKQFGKPLTEFQTLTHRLSDMFVAKENARAMVYRALSFMEAAPAHRAAAVSATMSAVIGAGEFVCGQAIQLHGGIGMTEEYAVSHHYKRHRAIALTHGDQTFHAERYRQWSMPRGSAA